jgi:eukaryotic-like serine/threonine-protein kinase
MTEAFARGDRRPQLEKYEIREEIGRGGMATVYRALDRRLGREVAVKVIHPHLRESLEVASRFRTEAQAVAKLRHPNIVEVYDVSGVDEPEQYLVVELVRGTTLRRLLQDLGPMPPEIAAAIAVELLEALAHAHACGVVHRDLKPENVLIEHRSAPFAAADDRAERGSRVSVKLTDFGIAKLLDAQGVTSTGQVLGSPAHMAPEQIEGGEVDARSDVFGLGVLLYECMVGHLPFEGSNPAQVLRRVLDGTYCPANLEEPRIGARWSAIIDRALMGTRQERFADAHAMRDALVAELKRLGFWPADRDLEAALDDPAAFAASHAQRIVERLRELADEARRGGRTLAAASDYNRALANAPDDPGLLRMVARIHRVELRNRALHRLGAGLAAVAAMAAVGYGIHRGVRRGLGHDVRGTERGGLIAPLPAVADGASLAEPRTAASTIAPAESASSSRFARAAPSKPIERALTIDLTPPMGVVVAVDRQPALSVSTGDVLTVDSHAHVLSFSCSVCTGIQVPVASGDRDETLFVSVPIKPAILVVEGDVEVTYQMTEHPAITVRAGTNTIALKSAFERVTVKQIETGTSVPVRLEAGKTVRVRF